MNLENRKINKYTCNSPQETKALGRSLAKDLKGSEVLLLFGNLGAGKTLFLQGLAEGLGVSGPVNSPTFNIMRLYKFKRDKRSQTFCHIDAYRLSSGEDLQTLGIEEIWQDKNSITAIEWAENISDIVPEKYYKISIAQTGEEKREITIEKKQ